MNRSQAVHKAKQMFERGSELNKAAVRLVKFNYRMIDYITQAPIIAGLFLPTYERLQHNDVYVRIAKSSPFDDKKTMTRLAALCLSGAKLRDVLKALDINPALRALTASDIHNTLRDVVKALYAVNVSALAQQLAKRSPAARQIYMEDIVHYWKAPPVVGSATVVWMAENMPVSEPHSRIDIPHIIDLFRARPNFHPSWKWRDLMAEMRKWEESFGTNHPTLWTPPLAAQARADVVAWTETLAAQNFNLTVDPAATVATNETLTRNRLIEMIAQVNAINATRGAVEDPTAPLSPHTDVISEKQYGEIKVVLLNTSADLRDEGARLRHCVGDYSPNVKSGRSLIYSLRAIKDSCSLATMELVAGSKVIRGGEERQTWSIQQVKAYSNGDPLPQVMDVVRLFTSEHFIMAPPRASREYSDWDVNQPRGGDLYRGVPSGDLYRERERRHAQREILFQRDFQDRLIQMALRDMGASYGAPEDWDTEIAVSPDGRSAELRFTRRHHLSAMLEFDVNIPNAAQEIGRATYSVSRGMMQGAERDTHEARRMMMRDMHPRHTLDYRDGGRMPWDRPRNLYEPQVNVFVAHGEPQYSRELQTRYTRPLRSIWYNDTI